MFTDTIKQMLFNTVGYPVHRKYLYLRYRWKELTDRKNRDWWRANRIKMFPESAESESQTQAAGVNAGLVIPEPPASMSETYKILFKRAYTQAQGQEASAFAKAIVLLAAIDKNARDGMNVSAEIKSKLEAAKPQLDKIRNEFPNDPDAVHQWVLAYSDAAALYYRKVTPKSWEK